MKTIVAETKTGISNTEAPDRRREPEPSLEEIGVSANVPPRSLAVAFAWLCLCGLAMSAHSKDFCDGSKKIGETGSPAL